MKRVAVILALALAAGAAVPAGAHHSAAAVYALDRHVQVEGVVTRFSLGNPHMRIYFTRTDDSSQSEWMAEGGSRTVLIRKGWTEEELKPGDAIVMEGSPSHSGNNTMLLQYITFPDGRRVFAEDFDPAVAARERRRPASDD